MIPLRIRIVPVLVFVLLVRWIMPLAMLLFIPIINRVNIITILLCWYWKLPSIIRVSVLKVIVNLHKPKLMMLNAGNDVCLTNNRKGRCYIYLLKCIIICWIANKKLKVMSQVHMKNSLNWSCYELVSSYWYIY